MKRRGLSVGLVSALGTMVVVLPTFWTMGQLGRWWTVPLMSVVMAVMLGLSLPRALAAVPRAYWAEAAAGLLVATVVASVASVWVSAGGLWRIAGAVVFAALAGVTVWLRRFGALWQAVGVVSALPLFAVLVAPMPTALSWNLLLWVIVAALAASIWAFATAYLSGVEAAAAPKAMSPSGRMLSSTRMAIQLCLAIGLASGAAQVIKLDHLVWPVLTALIVQSNNRGRGDVLWKGTQRLIGALVGTAVATALVGLWPAGDSRSVVAIFVLIGIAAVLRPFGYVYWAACVTAGLAFLYGFLGQGGLGELGQRLIGITVGGVIAIAVAWFLLPVRTIDVAKSRMKALGVTLRAIGDARAQGTVPASLVTEMTTARAELAKLQSTLAAAKVLGIGEIRTMSETVKELIAKADTAYLSCD